MRRRIEPKWLPVLGLLLCLAARPIQGNESASQAPPAPEMPEDWKVISDFDVPADQIEEIAQRLGATISSLRNTLYDVNGRQVQLNVIVAPDRANADKLMAKLRTMKSDVALLQKELIIYEFVGQNDVLPLIAEGRKHLDSD